MPGCDASFGSAKLVVFDFDETLSVCHVFKQLSKNDTNSATSELGQLRLVDELNTDADDRSEDSFSRQAIGGEQRQEELRRFFTMLRDRGVCLVVCTFGLAATVSKVLSQLGLLEFFSEVYGRGPGKYRETAYDKSLAGEAPTPTEAAFLADLEHYKWKDKGSVISKLRDRMRLNCSEVIFVDNDPERLRDAIGLCWTIWVKMNEGMTKEHLDEVEWRTRPTRVPRPLVSCLELFVNGHLRRHTEAQLSEARANGNAWRKNTMDFGK